MRLNVSVSGKWGVIDGADANTRRAIIDTLETMVEVVGDRVKFMPTRPALDALVAAGAQFDSKCRPAWSYLYRKKAVAPVADFKFKTEPRKYQYEIWRVIRDLEYYALEWEMGLGKTKEALDVAAWKYLTGQIDAVLVLTLKGVHRNWVEDEIPVHLAVENYKAAFWVPHRVEGGMRDLVEHDGLAIAAINFDSAHQPRGKAFIQKFLARRRVMVIVDEAHGIKTHNAARTKAILKFARDNGAVARMTMTGTPTGGSPLDVWPQYEFLSPSIIGMEFYPFRAFYSIMRPIPGRTYVPKGWTDPVTGRWVRNKDNIEKPVENIVGYRNLDQLKELLDPHRSRLLKDDHLDLPEKLYTKWTYELADEERKAYLSMREDLLIDLGDLRRVTAQMAITKMLRLRQLLCGHVKADDATEAEPFGKQTRLERYLEGCHQVRGKAITWSTFTFSLNQIADALRAEFGPKSVVVYHGQTPDNERALAKRAFQDPDSDVRWFVGHPRAGGTGLTLTQARTVIYYNNDFDLILRQQSEDRAHRIGQEYPVTYADLEAGGTIDRHIIRELRSKRNLASTLNGDDLAAWLSNDE